MNVLVNTHGGLGNQIFQIFYALNLCEKLDAKLFLNHILYYKHGFTLQLPTEKLDVGKPSNFDLILMHTRIGKIMENTKLSSGDIKICNKIILDGYFQNPKLYNAFSTQCLKKCLNKLTNAFEISPPTIDAELLHLRLGDFFRTRQEKLEEAYIELKKATNGQHIITDDEELMLLSEFTKIIKKNNLKLIKTSNFSAYKLLKFISNYQKITSNGSTLSIWASLLSGAKLKINASSQSTTAHFNENVQGFYKAIQGLNCQ